MTFNKFQNMLLGVAIGDAYGASDQKKSIEVYILEFRK
jgi:hypothetical protein